MEELEYKKQDIGSRFWSYASAFLLVLLVFTWIFWGGQNRSIGNDGIVLVQTNNTFTVDNGDGGGGQSISITPGNYNATSLLSHLKVILDASTPLSNAPWTVAFSNITMKFTFTRTNENVGSDVSFTFDNGIFPASALGFVSSTTYIFSPSGSNYVLTAPIVMSLNLESTILLQSSQVNNNLSIYLPIF